MKYDCCRIQFSGEDSWPDLNLYDYAMGFEVLDFDGRYLRLPLYAMRSSWAPALTKHTVPDEELLAKKKFCNFVVSNDYSNERNEFFAALNAHRPVDSGGGYMNNNGGAGGGKDASGTSRKHRSLRSPPRGGAGENETAAKDPQVAGLQTPRAAQTPPLKRTLPRAGANEKTKRTRRRRTAKIFATKRQRYPAGEDRGMFHVLSVTKAQTKRPAKRRPFFRRMPDKSL